MARLFIAISLVCTLAATAAFGQTTDRIFLVGKGTPINGTVMSMTPTEVVLDERGTERKYAVNEIMKLAFADEPAELERARDAVLKGQLESALDDLKKIDQAKVVSDAVKQDIAFYTAYCMGKLSLRGTGDRVDALNAVLSYLRDAPGNFHRFAAAELSGELAMALGRFDDAAKYYGAVAAAPWADYQLRAAVLSAHAQIAQGQFEPALANFDKVLASTAADPAAQRQKLFATVGRARCLAETGKPSEGRQMLEDVIAKNDSKDVELFGTAYNAMGYCYLRENKPKEAMLAFLHVDVLFYGDAPTHAEALYNLAKVYIDLNKNEKAVEARGLLKSRYGGTLWASKED